MAAPNAKVVALEGAVANIERRLNRLDAEGSNLVDELAKLRQELAVFVALTTERHEVSLRWSGRLWTILPPVLGVVVGALLGAFLVRR